MPGRVLVTPRSLTGEKHPAVEGMRELGFEIVYCAPGKLPDERDLLSLVPGCVGWLAGVEPISERVVEEACDLRVISRNGVGIDNLPLDALRRRGVRITLAEGANAVGVAELTVGLMLAAMRSIPSTDAGVKLGGWPRTRGREIRGRTVGVVGCGAIGREVAKLVAGLGATTLGFDPAKPRLDLPAESFRYADFAETISAADVVTLHCPAPPGRRALIDAAVLATMRSGAILVNTARATLVDREAVIAALDSQHLFAYAVDVFEQEPPRDLALAAHPRVIATSHIGGFTAESVDRATTIAVGNLVAALAETSHPGA